MGRIFDLDWQLLQDSVLLAVNLFLLFFVMSYALFHPVRAVLARRREQIEHTIANAEEMKREAATLHAAYEQKQKSAREEAEQIRKEAELFAEERKEQIIKEARKEAEEIRIRARREALQEREQEAEEQKRQIVKLAAFLAVKLLTQKIDEEMQDRLIQEGLKEMGERAWQIQ